MKTQVEFRSSKFSPFEGEEQEINPGLWGKRLAEYLVEGLATQGVKTEEIVAEDWGYYIPVQNEGFGSAYAVDIRMAMTMSSCASSIREGL